MNTWLRNVIIIIGLVIIILLIFYLQNKSSIDYLKKGQKLEYKILNSPTKENQITLMLHTVGGFHYTSNIYIVDGFHNSKQLPKKDFIKFPNGTGVFIKWNDDGICQIICDNKPVYNDFWTNKYKLQLTISQKEIDDLEKSGQVTRYSISAVTPNISK